MTKPSYEEPKRYVHLSKEAEELIVKPLELELARVRGLLQRIPHTTDFTIVPVTAAIPSGFIFPCVKDCVRCALEKGGAESADIGKLDTADKKTDREMAYRMECYQCKTFLGYASPSGRGENVAALMFLCEKCADGAWPMSFEEAGSAETGGEKAAPFTLEITKEEEGWYCWVTWPQGASFAIGESFETRHGAEEHMGIIRKMLETFPRTSQNQTASSGVDGAHEGMTADKSGSSLSSPPPQDKNVE